MYRIAFNVCASILCLLCLVFLGLDFLLTFFVIYVGVRILRVIDYWESNR